MVGGTGWDIGWKAGSRLECFISLLVLVYVFCCFIPITGGSVQRLTIRHSGDGILDLRV